MAVTRALLPLTSTSGEASIDTIGMGTVTFDVTGTWVGTLTFYVRGHGGTLNALDVAKADTPDTLVNTATANGVWAGTCAGYAQAVVKFTAYTSGTAYISMAASEGGGGGAGGGSGGAIAGDASAEKQDDQTALLETIDADTSGIATSLAIMDDWDESDRIKTNPIVGSAGIAGGTGTMDATTTRVTLATNDALLLRLTRLSRSDTYTGTGNGNTVDATSYAIKFFSVQVKGTGATPTSWTVEVEVSNDGTNFDTVPDLTHTNTSSNDGGLVGLPTPFPALYFRTKCTAVSLGSATNIVATIVGMP